jgi:hypothetical protein
LLASNSPTAINDIERVARSMSTWRRRALTTPRGSRCELRDARLRSVEQALTDERSQDGESEDAVQ